MDISDQEDYGLEFSEESDSEPNVDLENQYYNSKSLKNINASEAVKSLQEVLNIEGENKGDWGFKALKQMIKINFKLGNLEEMVERYKQLLTYMKTAVTRNYSEKSINSILNHISTSSNGEILNKCYDITLQTLKEYKNERLWFQTNIKLAQLYYIQKNYFQLTKIVKSLRDYIGIEDDTDNNHRRGTQLLEVYALEIQMCTDLKQNSKLKSLYTESLRIKSALPHPNIMGIIRECGGKMHLRDGKFFVAHTDFFQAFKNYEECGTLKATTCLKYVVLTNMLMSSTINPFDSPEAKPYKDFPELLAMTQLLNTYQANDTKGFEQTVRQHKDMINNDPFIQEHIEGLIRNVRIQFLGTLLKPYRHIAISRISFELNLDVDETEELLVSCILDGVISGRIDQINGILHMNYSKYSKSLACRYDALNDLVKRANSLLCAVLDKAD